MCRTASVISAAVTALVLGPWCQGPIPAATLDLGAEQIVRIGGSDLMVAGYSVPCYEDWNNDGLKDLVIGEGGGSLPGKVRVYPNVGTAAAPQLADFHYAQSQGADLACVSSGCLGVFPRVADWDGDLRKDLLVGLAEGTVKFYRNVGTDAEPTFDGGTLLQVGPTGAKTPINVGGRATLALTDWNNDGLRDLLAGALDGRVRLYLNAGTNAAPDYLGVATLQGLTGDLIVPSGRSSPVSMDLDGDGEKDLLTGNTNGEILLYSNEGADAAPSFSTYVRVDADGLAIDLPGTPRSRPFVTDWNSDGRLDLLVGSGDSRVRLYQAVPEPAALALLAAGILTVVLRQGRGRRRHVDR